MTDQREEREVLPIVVAVLGVICVCAGLVMLAGCAVLHVDTSTLPYGAESVDCHNSRFCPPNSYCGSATPTPDNPFLVCRPTQCCAEGIYTDPDAVGAKPVRVVGEQR